MCSTDSQVALYWISGEGREWKQFVQNRMIEIRRLVPHVRWRHCPGTQNPADIPVARRRSNSGSMAPRDLFNLTFVDDLPNECLKAKEKTTTSLLSMKEPDLVEFE